MTLQSSKHGADQAWHQFESDLALCAGNLDEDDYLIIAYKRANYFVQFAAQGTFGIRAEAACNACIQPPEAALSVDDYKRMRTLGWNGATETFEDNASPARDPDGSPNFFIDVAEPVDFAALAKLTVQTLRMVYHIGHPGELQYSAFSQDGTQIRFPTLRIKHRKN